MKKQISVCIFIILLLLIACNNANPTYDIKTNETRSEKTEKFDTTYDFTTYENLIKNFGNPKEIRNLTNEDYDLGHMNIVIRALRNDFENYKFKKGIYFSGNMPSGLALGIVLLIDDNNKVGRIIMGWPTAG